MQHHAPALGWCPTKPCYPEKTVLSAERCCAENSLSIQNYVEECCVGPGKRSAKRLIGEGKAGDLAVLTCISDLQEIARAKELIRKDEMHILVDRGQTRWHGEQTANLARHGFSDAFKRPWALLRCRSELFYYLLFQLFLKCLNFYNNKLTFFHNNNMEDIIFWI